jgi:hypothetical protein
LKRRRSAGWATRSTISAEYVPKEMRSALGGAGSDRARREVLTSEKCADAKNKKEIEEKIDALLAKEREFAENSAMPPASWGGRRVLHRRRLPQDSREMERPIAEVTPPKSNVARCGPCRDSGPAKVRAGPMRRFILGMQSAAAEKSANERKPAQKWRQKRWRKNP